MASVHHDRETSVLLRYLDSQRRHVLGAIEELSADSLRRPVLPSGWTCLGLVQHLALDVERFWFGAVVAGDRTIIDGLEDVSDAWAVDSGTPPETVLNLYRTEIERSNEIISTTPLDAAPGWWPVDLFGDFRLETLREIVLHVITETATHAGHLDAVRELIDGKQWLVIDA